MDKLKLAILLRSSSFDMNREGNKARGRMYSILQLSSALLLACFIPCRCLPGWLDISSSRIYPLRSCLIRLSLKNTHSVLFSSSAFFLNSHVHLLGHTSSILLYETYCFGREYLWPQRLTFCMSFSCWTNSYRVPSYHLQAVVTSICTTLYPG